MSRPLRRRSTSSVNFRKIDAFIDDMEENIKEKAAEVAEDVLETLFELSPHFSGEFGEMKAKSEYDANHKVSINGQAVTKHVEPTFSASTSQLHNQREQAKVRSKKESAKHYKISNYTDHAMNVETGSGWTVTSAYAPYSKTVQLMRARHRDVLK